MDPTLPPKFYRVQHKYSFTGYDTENGFWSQGHYSMQFSHWLNRGKITKHLDWKDRSSQPTPFISMFDNIEDAQKRAQMHWQRQEDAFIVSIDTSGLRKDTLIIPFSDTTVHLPVWRDAKGTTVFSVRDAASNFSLDFRIVQQSEWLALDGIGPERLQVLS